TELAERLAGDDAEYQARKALTVGGKAAHDALDGAGVGRLQLAAQGVGEQLLGQAVHEVRGALGQEGAQLVRAAKRAAVGQSAAGVDGLPAVTATPGADGVKVLQPEAERVEGRVTRGTPGVAAVPFHLLPQRAGR